MPAKLHWPVLCTPSSGLCFTSHHTMPLPAKRGGSTSTFCHVSRQCRPMATQGRLDLLRQGNLNQSLAWSMAFACETLQSVRFSAKTVENDSQWGATCAKHCKTNANITVTTYMGHLKPSLAQIKDFISKSMHLRSHVSKIRHFKVETKSPGQFCSKSGL